MLLSLLWLPLSGNGSTFLGQPTTNEEGAMAPEVSHRAVFITGSPHFIQGNQPCNSLDLSPQEVEKKQPSKRSAPCYTKAAIE
ncbi:hypothetical protein Y1Q_0000772 [Alligator mississippiensis]|uniref:Uncharacterized protein n=1 Tax=Alligator mississippiensis TaxID=8496 RepID=A0A151MCC4_ALLMI|nr:hypothetical protein Y1Q_0000772 [Alligator mississippiensis]